MSTENLTNPGNFNIRVYGICIKNDKLLLSDETFNGIKMTKLPGGGLNYGEGTIDCLKREAMEEFNCKIDIIEHFYTTDYFQPALFFSNTQLISIYYKIIIHGLPNVPDSQTPLPTTIENPQQLRWVKLNSIKPESLTFPIDQKVVEMLKREKY